MEYFWDTVETIPDGVGFSQFDGTHFAWIAAFIVFTALATILYKKSSEKTRHIILYVFAALLWADEIFKFVGLFLHGNYIPKYLPFHLCSINIFIITAHAIKPSKMLNNYLYGVAIPAALMAIIFPSWTELPAANFMHIHSSTVHILLAAYPIMLALCGELKPELKELPKSLALLAGLAAVAAVVNHICGTNFMFLSSASKGNPLYVFKQMWGNHLYGFPILITAVLFVMYLPVVLIKKFRKEKAEA